MKQVQPVAPGRPDAVNVAIMTEIHARTVPKFLIRPRFAAYSKMRPQGPPEQLWIVRRQPYQGLSLQILGLNSGDSYHAHNVICAAAAG